MVRTARKEVTSVWFEQFPDVIGQSILVWHRKLFAFHYIRQIRRGCDRLWSVENFANTASNRSHSLLCLDLLIPFEDDRGHHAHLACFFLHCAPDDISGVVVAELKSVVVKDIYEEQDGTPRPGKVDGMLKAF